MTVFNFDNRESFNFSDWNNIVSHIRDLKPGKWEVKIGPPRRSNPANSFYWVAIIDAFHEWSGYDEDEVHDLLKKRFLSYEKKGKDGKVRTLVKSTAKLNRKEFCEYCRKCERFGMELGFEFKEPPELVEYLKKHGIK